MFLHGPIEDLGEFLFRPIVILLQALHITLLSFAHTTLSNILNGHLYANSLEIVVCSAVHERIYVGVLAKRLQAPQLPVKLEPAISNAELAYGADPAMPNRTAKQGLTDGGDQFEVKPA